MPIGEWKYRVVADVKGSNGVWSCGCTGIGGSESQALSDLRQQYQYLGIQEVRVTKVQHNENGMWKD